MPYADEVEVTDGWYQPHFPARTDRPLEMAMVNHWKNFMSYESDHAVGWCSRLASLLSSIPRGLTVRQGRVAATFALWTMTPNGRSIGPLFERIAPDSSLLELDVAQEWARLNRLGSDLVDILMRDEHRKYVCDNPSYPTLEDYRTMEVTLIFLVGPLGRRLLRMVLDEAGEPRRFQL